MDATGDFDAFLNGKPSLAELCKHVSISTKWYQIGVLLEINSAKLDGIEKDCQGSDMKALKMFEFWLSSNPSASRKQIIDTLKTKSIGENTVAEEYQKALIKIQNLTIQGFRRQSESLSQVSFPMEVAHTLYTEGVFPEETFDHVNRSGGALAGGPLRALQNTISEDPNQLETFGTVLLQSEETVDIGKSTLKEFDHVRELYLSPTYRDSFDRIRTQLGALIMKIGPLIESAVTLSKFEELKTFLRVSFPELKPQLSTAESFDDIMDIVRGKCTPISIACLESLINRYKIEEAKAHIEDYRSEVEKFCKEIKLSICEHEDFITGQSSLLKCETIEFVVEWKTDEHTLEEIKDLLWKAFGDMAKRILVKKLRESNSIIVTCYAPRYMMDVLRKVAEKNLALLKQMGVIKLTIGYNVIWDATKRYEEVSPHEQELTKLLEKSRMETKAKDIEITTLQSALKEKEEIVSADWLKKAITDLHITAKAAPIILCITGLPNSSQSIATQSLLKQLQCEQFPVSEEHGVSFYEASAVRKPATTSLIYSNKFNYALVMESAIKYHFYLQGKFIKNIEVPSIPKSIFDNDDDLDCHFRQMIHDFYLNRASPGNRPGWNQGLPSGIAMINIWDVGTSKTALYILPMLAGHLYSSRVWMFFDLLRDLPHLYDPPEISNERSDEAPILKWHSRLYHLFRLAQLGSSKYHDRSNVCKLVACLDSSRSVGNEEEENMKGHFKKETIVAATQMNIENLVDMQDVIPFLSEDQEGLLKKTFDDIVNMELDKPVSLPLSYVFLRSLFYRIKDLLYVKKDVLGSKARKLEIFGDDFEHFCKVFTSLGSIIDISLINNDSNIVILQPVPYFHELDKLFYLHSETDLLVTKYGLVTKSRAANIFGDDKKAFDMMSSLVHFGIALKIEPSRISKLSPLSKHEYVYYVPDASTASAIADHGPNALCLLRDVDRAMIRPNVVFTKLFLEIYEKAMLYIPEHSPVNVTSIRAHSDNTDDGVIFKMVYLGDAIEFRFPSQQLHEDVVEQVVAVCHKMMEMTKFKYNFAVMCSNEVNQTAVYKLQQHYHHLPNNELCQMCKDNGKINKSLSMYNTVLSKVKNQVPKPKILNGDPLSFDNAYMVAKGMLELSENTLDVVCQCLDLPEKILFKDKLTWSCCMKILIDWEDLSSKNDASKKTLAIKLMKAANEIHKQSNEESKKLEIIARSLDYKVAYSMSTS